MEWTLKLSLQDALSLHCLLSCMLEDMEEDGPLFSDEAHNLGLQFLRAMLARLPNPDVFDVETPAAAYLN